MAYWETSIKRRQIQQKNKKSCTSPTTDHAALLPHMLDYIGPISLFNIKHRTVMSNQSCVNFFIVLEPCIKVGKYFVNNNVVVIFSHMEILTSARRF